MKRGGFSTIPIIAFNASSANEQVTIPIHFVLPEPERLGQLAQLDPDTDWREFVTTSRAWILQTYLRLCAVGEAVTLRADIPPTGIAFFCFGDRRALLRGSGKFSDALLVGVRGSHEGRSPLAEVEIIQNPVQVGPGRYFMTHWPQPALIARDSSRGTRIARVSFKGFPKNLHPDFTDGRWERYLASLGIEWEIDAVEYRDNATDGAQLHWNDFGQVDLVLAVRPPLPDLRATRPASKLYNAWFAGVPALLGPEFAYQALRRDARDYIEVTNLADAQQAVDFLRAHPEEYRAMVVRGRERAPEFDVGPTTERWRTLIHETLMPLARARTRRKGRLRVLRMREFAGRLRGWSGKLR